MSVTFPQIVDLLVKSDLIKLTFFLLIGAIIVNGATDAANAISGVVSTRTLKPSHAIILASLFNFLGVVVMSLVNHRVVDTIMNMVDFSGNNHFALIALCAGMIAVVIWATVAWMFGIPTSESHALIAGVTGAAVALQNGFKGINGGVWIRVISGLFVSTALGFILGYLLLKIMHFIFRRIKRKWAVRILKNLEIAGSSFMAFMHGAQDGQKFIGILMIAIMLGMGVDTSVGAEVPLLIMLLCSVLMAIGTGIGGKKIIKAVGMEMVKTNDIQAVASDFASATSLLISSTFGLPVSTTHTKTTALLGAGIATNRRGVKWSKAAEIIYAWVLTFPGCGLLGFFMAKLFLSVAGG
jgi:PiT family inorganic phosphate transporter